MITEDINKAIEDSSEISCIEISDLLSQHFVAITGGKSKEGYPIVTFPDCNNFHRLTDVEYKNLVSYVTSVPSMQEIDLGFVLIIDRRNDRWSSVKYVLYKLTEFFPALIHVVYVVRPSGFLQKAISEVSNTFFKEDFKFKVVICNDIRDLEQYIDKSELTSDLNGTLDYSHQDWIQQRIWLEKFSLQMKLVSSSLDDFTKAVESECMILPTTIEDTLNVLNEQTIRYKSLKQNIFDSSKRAECLLTDMKSSVMLSHNPSVINNVSSVERLLVQLEETERKFDKFWEYHESRLKQCFELRSFEHDFRITQVKLDDYLKIALEMTEIGDSVDCVDHLIAQLNDFHSSCQKEIEESDKLMKRGSDMISKDRYIDLEAIQPKCEELRRINQSLAERLLRRVDTLKKSRELQLRISKANTWCARGIQLLASQNIEKCSMFPEHSQQALTELEAFVASADDFNVSGSEDLYVLFQDSITPETKPLVTQVLQRIEDVTVMCDKRITNLRRLIAKPNRPIQPVTPEPAVPISNNNNNNQLPKDISCDCTDNVQKNGNPIEEIDIIEKVTRSKQKHILNELLETEQIYVTEIKSVITGYKDTMENSELKNLVPMELKDKKSTLFCNLDELYEFHAVTFLPKLKSCINNTEEVAALFQQQKVRLTQLYSFYCQNLVYSEKLREKVGERNPFFLACQIKLEHKLPLAAYMLKPVQRITKYQLLLKDLIKELKEDKCVSALEQALDCMLLVLKCVNDRMHQVSIIGFPGQLSEQGELLLQGSFAVWFENKKDLLKELRIKPMRRHVFLYRKALLLCKKSSKEGYHFKHVLKMSKIGLTETVKGDGKKFEIWLQGRQEVYTIQASTIEQKEAWVREIKKVLFEQLTELKGEQIRQYGDKYTSQFRTISLDSIGIGSGGSSRGNSRPSSHHEVSDDDSSDLSNSEDESYSSHIPNGKFVALADYCAAGENEISLKEGDPLELLKVGRTGWWYIKLLKNNSEGWVPASFLEQKDGRKSSSSRSITSVNSQ